MSNFKIFTLLLVVTFMAATVQAKVIEAGTEQSNFKKYSNSEFGFEMQYPSSWTAEELDFDPDVNTYVVEFDSPPEGAEDRYSDFLNVEIRPFEGSRIQADQQGGDEELLAQLGEYLTLSAYVDDLKRDYQNTYDNFQNLSFDFVKLGDRHAYSLVQTHTLQLPDGEIDLKVMETMTIVGDKVYSLKYTAEKDKYSKYLSLANDMIKSFKFTSPPGNLDDQGLPLPEISTSNSSSTSGLSGFKSYRNSDYGIEVQIPSIWEIDENDLNPNDSLTEIAYFLTPFTESSDSYHEIVGLFSEELSFTSKALPDYLNYSINAYSQAQDNFQVISSDTNTEFAGRPGYNLIYTSTLKDEDNNEDNDIKLKTIESGTIIDDKSYYISYTAQSKNYEKYLPEVQQIIDSVKVLGDNSSTSVTTSEPSAIGKNISSIKGETPSFNTTMRNETQLEFLTFVSNETGVSIQYPSEWTEESFSNLTDDEIVPIVLISPPISSDPNANTFLEIGYDSSIQANNFSLDEYVRGVIQTQQSNGEISDFKVDSVKTDTIFANRSAYTLVSSRNTDGIGMKSLEVGT